MLKKQKGIHISVRSILLLGIMCAVLFSACGSRTETPQTAIETVTPAPTPTEAPTPVPPEEWLRRPGEKTAEETGSELRWEKSETARQYAILARNGGNSTGADSLMRYLLGDGLETALTYGTELCGEAMYSLCADAAAQTEAPVYATEETARLTVFTEPELIESELLFAMIPAFERDWGYSVELWVASGEETRLPAVELAILSTETAHRLTGTEELRAYVPYLETRFVPQGR